MSFASGFSLWKPFGSTESAMDVYAELQLTKGATLAEAAEAFKRRATELHGSGKSFSRAHQAKPFEKK